MLEQGSGRWQGVSGGGESIVQPLFVFSVGLENDRVLEALYTLGQRGERVILTANLEVWACLSCAPTPGSESGPLSYTALHWQ